MNYPIKTDVWLDGEYLIKTLITCQRDYRILETTYDAVIAVSINKEDCQELRMYSRITTDKMCA